MNSPKNYGRESLKPFINFTKAMLEISALPAILSASIYFCYIKPIRDAYASGEYRAELVRHDAGRHHVFTKGLGTKDALSCIEYSRFYLALLDDYISDATSLEIECFPFPGFLFVDGFYSPNQQRIVLIERSHIRAIVLHEICHAIDLPVDDNAIISNNSIFAKPPFITKYAEESPHEDFAETCSYVIDKETGILDKIRLNPDTNVFYRETTPGMQVKIGHTRNLLESLTSKDSKSHSE